MESYSHALDTAKPWLEITKIGSLSLQSDWLDQPSQETTTSASLYKYLMGGDILEDIARIIVLCLVWSVSQTLGLQSAQFGAAN